MEKEKGVLALETLISCSGLQLSADMGNIKGIEQMTLALVRMQLLHPFYDQK